MYEKEFGPTMAARVLSRIDRWYLFCVVLRRSDGWHPWVYARCREVERATDGHLDLWAREHFKTSVITFTGIVQEILINPEITIGIFSHTAPRSKAILAQIKREFEDNQVIKDAFPDIVWGNAQREAKMWSLDFGITVKRKSNPKEATVEAHGLVDGQPIGKHFGLMVYDDVVVPESVSTPEQVAKTTKAWELSDNLGSKEGRKWHIGTRYSYADTYESILKRGSLVPRIHPATKDGTIHGEPVYFSQDLWERKVRDQGEATIACHCAGTQVLMADLTWRSIESLRIGDSVVGYVFGKGKGQKATLVPTTVMATSERIAEAVEYTTDAGSIVRCTPDHKWWTKRSGCDAHSIYAALGSLAKKNLKSLARIAWKEAPDDRREWPYLAGLLDGEGSVSGHQVTLTQSPEHNPEVFASMRRILDALGIDHGVYHRPAGRSHGKNSKASAIIYLRGGRRLRHKIVQLAQPAKRDALIRSWFGALGGKSETVSERVIGARPLGYLPVFNIQTETGNYIAEGFASKNCQMLQNPMAGAQAMFNVEDLKVYEIRPTTLNVYVLCDPARSKKKDSANTAIAVIGLDYAANKYLLDGYNHRMDLQERWVRFRDMYVKWVQAPGVQNVKMGYESFGALADLDYFREKMRLEQLHFDITELAWPREGDGSKMDRVQRLGPDFRQGRFHVPYDTNPEKLTKLQADTAHGGHPYRIARPIKRKDGDGNVYDLTQQFREQVHYFPFGTLKDLVDAAARIYDIEPVPPLVFEQGSVDPDIV